MTELQPDRESDALIAKRLGFEVSEEGMREEPWQYWDEMPYYTTDLNMAFGIMWSVFVRDKPGFELRRNPYNNNWSCRMSEGGQVSIAVHAASPALAVCRAWMDGKEREA